MTQYLLSIYQPDGPAPGPEVLLLWTPALSGRPPCALTTTGVSAWLDFPLAWRDLPRAWTPNHWGFCTFLEPPVRRP